MKLSIRCLGRWLLNLLRLRTDFAWLVLGAILPLLAGCGRFDDEFNIKSETAKVIVSRDGTALVSETFGLTVMTAVNYGGVYVDIPQRFTDSQGAAHWRTFELLSTLRDGSDEHHSYAATPDGRSIYIGRPSCKSCKSLPMGATQMEIDYQIGRLIRERDGHQILVLPAYMASVHGRAPRKTVVFSIPEGGKLLSLSMDQPGYDVRQTRSNDFVVSVDPGKSDRTLRDIEIEYPAGTFPAATQTDEVRWWFLDHVMLAALLAGPLLGCLVIGLNLRTRWRPVGPAAGSIDDIRLDKISPTLIAYLQLSWQEPQAKRRAFMASVCGLAIERKLRISGLGDKAEIADLAASGHTRANPPDMQDLKAWILVNANLLRPYRHRIRVSRIWADMGDRLRLIATEEWRENGGKDGAQYAWAIILILLSVPVVAYLSGLAMFVGSILVLLFVGLAVMVKLLRPGKSHVTLPDRQQLKTVMSMVVALPVLTIFAASYLVNNPASSEQLPYLIAACISVLCVALIGAMWAVPTRRERHFGHDLSMLRRYLTGELEGPVMSVEIYERYLPYAVAFGLEQQWTAAFDRWTVAAGMAGYKPDWLIRREDDTV